MPIAQRPAGHIVQHQEGSIASDPYLQHPHQMRVRQARQALQFAQHDYPLARPQSDKQNLDRHAAPALLAFAEINLRETALAEQVDQSIAAQLASNEICHTKTILLKRYTLH